MAWAVTSRGVADSDLVSPDTQALSAFTPTANSLLLFFGHAETDNASNVNPTVSDPTGMTPTLVGKLDGTSAVNASYEVCIALYREAVGGSPSSMTITWDGTSDANGAWYTIGALDITGHNVASPIVQSKTAGTEHTGGSANPTHAVTLDSTPATGNLVVVAFSAACDPTGATDMAAPTIGTQAMTKVQGTAPNAYEHHIVYTREIDGTETNATITCAGMTGTGGTAFKSMAIAAEIAVAGPPPTLMFLAPIQSALRLR